MRFNQATIDNSDHAFELRTLFHALLGSPTTEYIQSTRENEMGIRDSALEMNALRSKQMLLNASHHPRFRTLNYPLIQGHTTHTSAIQISMCEGQEKQHNLTMARPRIMEHQKSMF